MSSAETTTPWLAAPPPNVHGASVLTVDVGGTDLKSALWDAAGGLVDVRRVGTPRSVDHPGDAVVERTARLLEEYRLAWPDRPIGAIGMIAPGLVDEVRGVGVFSANLGWRDYPFAERVGAVTGLPATFGHDVGAAGEAEVRLGAARGLSDVVVMIIGTGIAAAVFCGGQRVQGGGFAGEVGHAQVPGGERCACGAMGCLETLGSAGAIARRYSQRSGVAVDGAREVLRLARSGDRDAVDVVEDAVAALAFSVGQLAATLGTEAVVIGGGLAQAGDRLFDPLRGAVDNALSFHRRPRLLAARMGQDAGLIGAALRARGLLENP